MRGIEIIKNPLQFPDEIKFAGNDIKVLFYKWSLHQHNKFFVSRKFLEWNLEIEL